MPVPRIPTAPVIRQLTAEERQYVRTLHFDANMRKVDIYRITNFLIDQIRYAIHPESAQPKPRWGRPRKMTIDQEEELLTYVYLSKENRRMNFLELSIRLFDANIYTSTIKHCLYRYGFRRQVTRIKPLITEIN